MKINTPRHVEVIFYEGDYFDFDGNRIQSLTDKNIEHTLHDFVVTFVPENAIERTIYNRAASLCGEPVLTDE